MKHLILAASLVLIAVPAFAGGSKQDVNLPKSNTMTFTDTQVGGTPAVMT